MLATIRSAGVMGIDAYPVDIEADVGLGLPAYTLVGLPDSAVKEGFVRVRAALEHAGWPLPPRRITINFAPADVRKDGAAFDLPIALALLAALGELDPTSFRDRLWVGELGLDGSVRRVSGALPMALYAKRAGMSGIVLPAACAGEAAVLRALPVHPVHHLRELVDTLRAKKPLPAFTDQERETLLATSAMESALADLQDIRGNEHPKRALEVAAAGGHNLLFLGPPGTGKSMLAQRLPGILPPLSEQESLEVTAVYSSSGLLGNRPLLHHRPFRSPHHDVSAAGLVGGGSWPRPGEVSLAHHGVLFLDELPEFKRPVLEALRQPIEDRKISIVRARCAITYPASFTLVAAMNPCPCGYRGSSVRNCTCDLGRVAQYMGRLSGPLIDRFDLHVEVPHVDYASLLSTERTGDSSSTVRTRVLRARDRQHKRYQHHPPGTWNASLQADALLQVAKPDAAGERLLTTYAQKHALSSRAVHRVLKVARTIADLAEVDAVSSTHVAEALTLRVLDRPLWQ